MPDPPAGMWWEVKFDTPLAQTFLMVKLRRKVYGIFNKTVDWSCYQPSSDPEINAYRATWLAEYILKGEGATGLRRRGYDLNGLTGYRRG
ncbi:hypothetical protein [Mycobacteroides abscessus]|uniref:hypothetical protein n=1 Tax=Mycobacteroides abscessus TaxID=36809 RepID=UPI0009274E32|nr:hypothetical protein [Mycobacteroides abscessus]SHT13175.1 Uncharacterised protein [Mycobacteroides abscessus subsp. bolletii]SKE95234.1 Uncharacterised protein [Mycobacteroides abscessus subsp. bolletii]SKE98934.1 Uncharacterised protein [Mycobacteroides abscessus subsp. bolletii]SKF07736.1 Uncharacterised protein [Mycobacteroides abscessus subsp. bolletii]SKF44135.1 Uncharacterised protein [Mycobacteroides abscessus subsp. bolletii]